MIEPNDSKTLLHAYPHPQFGPGKIHVLNDELDDTGNQRTLCGKTLEMCPGEILRDSTALVTCKVCHNSILSAAKWAEQSARWQRETEERERQKLEQNRQWWAAYDQYLQTPIWHEKRRLVMARAGGNCEGCRLRRAAQVHHLRYPSSIWPGSAEWIKAEKLFDLVALCQSCHHDLHPERFDEPQIPEPWRATRGLT